jgi:hypothetical protein
MRPISSQLMQSYTAGAFAMRQVLRDEKFDLGCFNS